MTDSRLNPPKVEKQGHLTLEEISDILFGTPVQQNSSNGQMGLDKDNTMQEVGFLEETHISINCKPVFLRLASPSIEYNVHYFKYNDINNEYTLLASKQEIEIRRNWLTRHFKLLNVKKRKIFSNDDNAELVINPDDMFKLYQNQHNFTVLCQLSDECLKQNIVPSKLFFKMNQDMVVFILYKENLEYFLTNDNEKILDLMIESKLFQSTISHKINHLFKRDD